jgi:hypothetical protein
MYPTIAAIRTARTTATLGKAGPPSAFLFVAVLLTGIVQPDSQDPAIIVCAVSNVNT